MTPRRIALVTRRFWPLVGGGAGMAAELATGFARRGHHPTVLTIAWQKSWPQSFAFEEVPVERLPFVPGKLLGAWHHSRALAQWLRARADAFDVVYVLGSPRDVATAAGALEGADVPVISITLSAGEHPASGFGAGYLAIRRPSARSATVVASESTRRALIAAGASPDNLHVIPPGVRIAPAPVEGRRSEARKVLSQLSAQYPLGEFSPLAVGTADLTVARGPATLIEAWTRVWQKRRDARLWLLGAGPVRVDLAEWLADQAMSQCALLPGIWEELDELLAAANLFVSPSVREDCSLSLIRAMAAGLPIVAVDCPAHREVLAADRQALFYPPDDIPACAAALFQVLSEPAVASDLGSAAYRRAAEEFSIEHCVDRHEALIERLLQGRR